MQSTEQVLKVAPELLEYQVSILNMLRKGKKDLLKDQMKNTHKMHSIEVEKQQLIGPSTSTNCFLSANLQASQLAVGISRLDPLEEKAPDVQADGGPSGSAGEGPRRT